MVAKHLQTTADLLHSLGFTFNVPKSHLIPSQMFPFIGAFLDMVQFRAFPPEQRVWDIQAIILMFQSETWVTARSALRFLGLIASYILLVAHAGWHMRAQQWDLKSQWAQHQGNLSDCVQISKETAEDLQ